MDVKELLELTAFQKTRVILTAVELDLFPLLNEPHSADEVVRKRNLDLRAATRLLNVLTALGMLELVDGRYVTSSSLRKELGEGPESMIGLLKHRARLWKVWSSLSDIVRTGKTHYELKEPDFDYREHIQTFTRAMSVGGRIQAGETIDKLDLTGVDRVLDIGGGPGIFAAEFAEALPHAEIYVLDRPGVRNVAGEYIGDLLDSGRVKYIDGDVLEVTDEEVIGKDRSRRHDIAFMSNFIHAISPEEVREVIGRCVRWCRPGGRIVFKDFFVDDTRTKPARAALFSINMLVGTPGGDAYSWTEMETWLREAKHPAEKSAVTDINRLVMSDGNTGIIIARTKE